MSNFTDIIKHKVLKALCDFSMLENTGEIIVGFSGGADSVCLLHILNSFKDSFGYSLKAVHINHGIRGDEAKRDENFAESFCSIYNIPFLVFSFNCIEEVKKSKESLEECGRRLRYESFNKACSGKSKIATAHNANDNAETIIFNLTRGTSVKGLSGIPIVRGNIIRPLLYCSRKEIEGYCSENGLEYVTDSTNAEVDYTRNKIRHLIMPVLEDINPSYISAFSSLSDNARSVNEFIKKESAILLSNARISDFTYRRKVLSEANKSVATDTLYSEFLAFSGLNLDSKKINLLYDLLSKGGRMQLYGNIFAEVKKDYLRFYRKEDAISNAAIEISELPFEIEFGEYFLNLEKINNYSKIVNQIDAVNVINYNSISGNLVLRTRKAGDSFTFPKRNVTKTLKKLFTEENIPIELRDKIPVISDEIGIVWVYGFGVTKRCCVGKHSDNIILVRGKNNDK